MYAYTRYENIIPTKNTVISLFFHLFTINIKAFLTSQQLQNMR